MLKHKRLVSLIATLAFCLSFLAPALIAPAPAFAGSSYTAITAPPVTVGSNKVLGTVKVKVEEVGALTTIDNLSVSLPSGITLQNFTGVSPATPIGAAGQDIVITAPAALDGSTVPNPFNGGPGAWITATPTSANSFNIRIDPTTLVAAGASGPAQFSIQFANMKVSGPAGDITASFATGGQAFSPGSEVIGKLTSGGGATLSMAKSVKTVSKGTGQIIDQILIYESTPGTFQVGDVIKLKLPSGFSWDSVPVVSGGWTMSGYSSAAGAGDYTIGATGNQDITVTINRVSSNQTQTAMLSIGAVLDASTNAGLPTITVPDSASLGDVVVEISATNATTTTNITSADIVVAKVGDYGVTVADDTKTELFNGSIENVIGSFTITESIAGSLIAGRSVRLTLPDGVKWQTNPSVTVVDGDTLLTQARWTVVPDTSNRTISQNIPDNIATRSITTLKIEKGKVAISPSFSGPLTIKVSGYAGAEGEVTVADVKPRIELSADAAKDVVIGLPNQVVSDITIKESKKGAIMDGASNDLLAFRLPDGLTFSTTPTVTVTEGDLAIDSVKVVNDDKDLQLTIKSSSRTPSTLKISDIKITSTRYVPEGPVKLSLVKADPTGPSGSVAIDETTTALFALADRTSPGSVVIANCVTPAPADQGRNASFYIGSTIMNVNGTNIIMDVAPYIKAGRTYVPVRYLGDALGADTSWDEATKTVTVTKGDKTVVLVIGSTIAKVNGADVQMDVAPEITGVGRTMLPARWVAEGLGFQVGWNEALKQVVIQ